VRLFRGHPSDEREVGRVVRRLERHTTVTNGYSHRLKRPHGGEITVEYEMGVDTRVPSADFTLSAFGLPEPAGSPAKSMPTYVWLLLAAGACAALACGLRHLARRGRPAPVA
jgi:hypothetical protein